MLYYGLEQHSLDSYFQFKELGSAPSTPTTSEIRLYAKDDGGGISTLCYKNDAGTEICLPSSGTIVTGTGVNGRVAFWNGTSTITSDADLTFSVDTLTATKIIAPTSLTISAMTSGSVIFAGASGLLSQDNANLFWDDTNNRLGIGTTAPERTLHAVLSGSATQPIGAHNYSGGATTPINGVIFRSARGTVGSPTAVQADDTAVVLAFQGYGATGFSASKRASIEMLAGENWTDAAQGTYLRFLTTALTGTTTAEKFRIGPSGQWGIGGATFGTALDVFTSGGASAAPTWTSPGALTKTDDTNVTLTLGGTPATALLRSASLTLGWTGQLAVGRGGTGATAFTQGSVVFAGASGVYSQDNSNFFWDATNHRLGIGTSSPVSKLNTASLSTSAARGIISDQYSADVNAATFIGRKTRGASVGSFSAALADDIICSFRSHSSDGSGFLNGFAFLRTIATETQSSTAQGTRVQIQTVAPTTTTASVILELSDTGNVILGKQAALATTATDGFAHIPTCAGVPTGTPTAITGKVPMVYDTTDNKLYIYNGGWKTTTVFA